MASNCSEQTRKMRSEAAKKRWADPVFKEMVSRKLRKRVSVPCQCGCGGMAAVGKKFVHGHNSRVSHPMQGKKHLPETIKKMVENHVYPSGEDHPMFGKTHTPEARRKLSESHKGVKQSQELIDKRTEARRGYRHSEETLLKIGAGNKGKIISVDTRKKLSEANKGKRHSPETEFAKGATPWIAGKNHSEETKEKMRGRHVSEENRKKLSVALQGRTLSAEHIRKALSRRTPTSLEKKFQSIIEKHNLPYRFVGDGSFIIGRKNPDFINTNGEKVAIEVYARYYKLRHAETVQAWIEERERIFKEHGWKVLFFDAMQVTEENILKHLREVA